MEFQNSIRWNTSWDGLVSIGKVRRNAKTPLATNAHTLDPVLEPGNYVSFTYAE